MSDELRGRSFYKMTGSGNDFLFFDARAEAPGALETPAVIARLCARGTGVGGDGVVFLVNTPKADVGIRYYNSDGSTASLCGNATLCTTNLAVTIGAAPASGFTIETDAGVVKARISDGLPEFDMPAAGNIQADYQPIPRRANERRLAYLTVGNPHVVIQVDDLEAIDLMGRGRPVRYDASLPEGANVNFVARRPDGGWSIRTYERGVEGETLACGTGTAASAVALREWGESGDRTELLTRSGEPLGVRLWRDAGAWQPSLRGEGRLVYRGVLETV